MGLYQRLEDKWYGLLDRIDKVVPVYKMIDPIDKVVPSFVLFLVLVVLLLGWGLFLLPPEEKGGDRFTVVFEVKDSKGTLQEGITVHFKIGEKESDEETDEKGRIELKDIEKGTEIEYSVEESREFKRYTPTSQTIEEERVIPIRLFRKQAESFSKKIYFKEKGTDKLITGKDIYIRVGCSNSEVSLEQVSFTDYDQDGVIEVSDIPADCGTLIVDSVSVDGFETTSSAINSDPGEVFLEPLSNEKAKGTLVVTVEDEEGNPLDEILVELWKWGAVMDSARTVGGEVRFKEEAGGNYSIVASDTRLQFASKTVENVRITAGTEEYETVRLSKSVKGNISVEVVDSFSKAKVKNALAELYIKDAADGFIGSKNTGENAEKVVFAVEDEEEFVLYASAEGFKPNSITFSLPAGNTYPKEKSVEIELEKCTSVNCGIVKVTVEDEDKKRVENARVYLRNPDGSILKGIPPKTTDSNGFVKWAGMKEIPVYAYAEKFPANGKSEVKQIQLAKATQFRVEMVIGNAKLHVKTVDRDGQPIFGSTIEVFDASGKEESKVFLLENGEITQEIKADKSVYLIAKHDNYASYQTKVYQLYPDKTIEIEVAMIERQLGAIEVMDSTIDFFDEEGKKVSVLQNGKIYEAIMKIVIPEGTKYSQAGIHFRAGKTSHIANDLLYIKKVNAGNASIVKGTTFNPPMGGNTDLKEANLSAGDGKWANVVFLDPQPGVIEAGFRIKVDEKTTPGAELEVNFRAWGKLSNGSYERDPFDSGLGQSDSTSSKQALYAETFGPKYREGETEECNPNQICLSNTVLFDEQEEINIRAPYRVKIGGSYTYSFKLTNNSETRYENPEIFVSNTSAEGSKREVLEVSSYNINNFHGSKKVFEIPGIDMGLFSRNAFIEGKLTFTARKLGTSYYRLRIVSNAEVVYEKFVEVQAISDDALSLNILPEEIPSNIPVNVQAEARDPDDDPVNDAVIKVYRKDLSGVKSLILGGLEEIKTEPNGRTSFTVPASGPGSTLYFTAEKYGYESIEVERAVSSQILEISPKKISVSLSSREGGKNEEYAGIDLLNKLNEDLTITRLELNGRPDFLDYYLNMATINNYFGSFYPPTGSTTRIPANGYLPFGTKLFYAKLASGLSEESARIDANLSIIVSDSAGNSWLFNVPVKINIGVGAELENYECLSLSLSNWSAIAQETTITSPSFDIENNCRDSETGELVEVKNLKATLNWASPQSGTVKATIGGWEEELKPGQASVFVSTLAPEEKVSGFLSFTPEAGKLELDKRFSVKIEAEIETSSGTKTVSSVPSSIQALVGNINLADCLQVYDPADKDNVLNIEGEEEGSFQVDATNCGVGSGGIEIEVAFCRSDRDCTGGLGEGLGLGLSSRVGRGWKTTLNSANESKSIPVERIGYPGIYGITIEARTTGRPAWQKIKDFDVVADPNPEQFFSLKNYELVLPREGDRGAVTLVNNKLSDSWDVTASVCSWENKDSSWKDNWFNAGKGAIGGGMGWIGYALKVKDLAVFSPWGLAFLFGGAVLGFLFGQNECDPTDHRTLPDYIINLSGWGPGNSTVDASPLELETLARIGLVKKGDYPLGWNFDETVQSEGYGKEEVGIEFENLGEESIEPIYGVLDINVMQHHIGQKSVGINISDKNKKFGTAFGIFDLKKYDVTDYYSQKFHLRFITKQEKIELPPLDQNLYDCFSPVGGITGRTGEDALPKIKLDWSFENGHIDWDSCDENSGVYCDATQFSIEVWKRIAKFNEFMEENNFSFSCPQNAGEAIAKKAMGDARTIDDGKIGISNLSYSFKNGTATITTTVQNNSVLDSATLVLTLHPPANVEYEGESSCSEELSFAEGETSKTVKCGFTELPKSENSYMVTSSLAVASPALVQAGAPYISFLAQESTASECWIPQMTGFVGEFFPLNFYLNKRDPDFGQYVTQEKIKWKGQEISTNSEEIEGIVRELEELTHFNALLIKDGFSQDFQDDFVKYYKSTPFFQVPSLQLDSDDGTKTMDEIEKYFSDTHKFKFSTRHVGSNQLPDAGLYHVNINIDFQGNNWRLFTSSGEPNATIVVKLERLKRPEHNNSFYYLPFNGRVGEENGVLKRSGYGIGFEGEGDRIWVSETSELVQTWPATGAVALTNVKVETKDDVASLNSELDSRGSLLAIKGDQYSKKMVWSPSYATPVGLKMARNSKTTEPFHAAYSLRKDNEGIDAGKSLAFWNGMGRCIDFEGQDARDVFYYKADRKAETNEARNWLYAYLNQWNSAAYTGNVYLKTILFTPAGQRFMLKAEEPQTLKFFSPPNDAFDKSQAFIEGISGMQWNNKDDPINSIQDVFGLVKEKRACVTAVEDGTKMRFFWNEARLWGAEGAGQSFNGFEEEKLSVPGRNCIGPN